MGYIIIFLRNFLRVVPQNIQLFNGSIVENIVLDKQINEDSLNSFN